MGWTSWDFTALLGLCIGTHAWMLAQAAGTNSEWLQFVSQIGSVGFAVWCAYYLTTVAGPKKDAEFALTIKDITDKFTTELKAMRTDHRQDLSVLWTAYRDESEKTRGALDRLSAAIRDDESKIMRGRGTA